MENLLELALKNVRVLAKWPFFIYMYSTEMAAIKRVKKFCVGVCCYSYRDLV